jgi:hypothetical protein
MLAAVANSAGTSRGGDTAPQGREAGGCCKLGARRGKGVLRREGETSAAAANSRMHQILQRTASKLAGRTALCARVERERDWEGEGGVIIQPSTERDGSESREQGW